MDGHTLAGTVDALRDEAGALVERMPQGNYANARGLRLNKYGAGPFGDLLVPPLPVGPGVYVVVVEHVPVYVGRAAGLRERWGARGYSRIHPRNCFEGGQSTNCKVNAAIVRELKQGNGVALWYVETLEFVAVELETIARLLPIWNGRQ